MGICCYLPTKCVNTTYAQACKQAGYEQPVSSKYLGCTRVELVKDLGADTTQQLAGEDAQQGPGQVQGVENVAHLVGALRHELSLVLLQKVEVQQILGGQRLHTHHSLTKQSAPRVYVNAFTNVLGSVTKAY